MPPKFVRPEDLETLARRFLEEHHSSLEAPVPIEEIVEFGLGLDVVPLPNLYRDFQIESWLSHDTRTIFVDLRRCEEMETRYRFSLAHEVGHLLLHADLYRGSRLASFSAWLAFHEEVVRIRLSGDRLGRRLRLEPG